MNGTTKNQAAMVCVYFEVISNLILKDRTHSRVFHEHEKLAILPLLPTVYSHMFSSLLYLHHIMLVDTSASLHLKVENVIGPCHLL